MRAVLCDDYQGIDALRIGDVDLPAPGPGEVAIDVAAAGVNFADTLIVAGKYQEKPQTPFSPGFEIAGTVTAVGKGVSHVGVGERVMAILGKGGYAESAIAPGDAVFPIPETLDFVSAAGFPITYGTAHAALVWRAGLKAGETLVVHGAAGGVGLAAVEVGKALGAHVIATAGGPEKLEVARRHGADEAIDYREEDVRARIKALTDGAGADVVFDPVGGKVFEASLRSTAWCGRIVVIGFASGEVPSVPANILLVKNISVMGLYWGSYWKHAPDLLHKEFEALFRWYEAGSLHPHVSHTFALGDAQDAMRMLQSRKATGKVVLSIA
ncbi:NADPH:quinone oxidoreductase family protein [Ferruginivarius sediminum]|uniref:NADPH:quinone oxidoreductase family protein n=1 Tax=Ferruginivarius sediminum TaxID=2661937 RepID=A0A369T4G9_9PROT|nr:NADPH:quinone oxidoreductase family protein [Ferruginivarius sediminum]RDD60230.1 NADPH:quinone oxidoreductase family protein [Ferruginivarius sediminum]